MTANENNAGKADWKVLGQLVREISTGRPIDDIMRRNLPAVAEAVGADVVTVLQRDDTTQALSLIASWGVDDVEPFPLDDGQELVSALGPDGCALFMHDARLLGSDDPELHGSDLPTMARCIPLIFQGGGLGAMTFARKDQSRQFDRDEQSLIYSIAAQVSMAMGICAPCGDVLSRERAERALQFAHTLQATFTPTSATAAGGFAVSARRVTSLEMGGDFYDQVELPGNRTALVIGSSSGVGVEAGLRAARIMFDVRGILLCETDPGVALGKLNDLVIQHARGKNLVNMLIGLLDRTTGTFDCAGAGSANVYLAPGGTQGLQMCDVVSGNPVGLLSGWTFRGHRIELPVGGTLVMHTDGLLHNAFEAGAAFDVSDIATAISTAVAGGHPPADGVVDALRNRTGWQLGSEDVTVLAIRREA